MPKISITEEAGMPYETRCREAHSSLFGMWEMFQRQSDIDLRKRHKNSVCAEVVLSSISSTDARAAMTDFLADLANISLVLQEALYQKVWEEAIQRSCDLYGLSETELALKSLGLKKIKN